MGRSQRQKGLGHILLGIFLDPSILLCIGSSVYAALPCGLNFYARLYGNRNYELRSHGQTIHGQTLKFPGKLQPSFHRAHELLYVLVH